MKTHPMILRVSILITYLTIFISCNDDLPLPENKATFETDHIGITDKENQVNISMPLSRPLENTASLQITLEAKGLIYGTDFTTLPEAENNIISYTLKAGESKASIAIIKVKGALYDGDESVQLSLTKTSEGIIIGDKKSVMITFAELVATRASLNIQGGGAKFPYRVFIDLSSTRQTAINRSEWDLGFSTQAASYNVILNNAVNMLAKVTTKNDITQISATDSSGMKAGFSTDTFNPANLPYSDDPTGDLTKTAITEIRSTESENKVYLINRGKDANGIQRSWKKVRILRTSNGYTIQHADINATTYHTLQISKNESVNFIYVNLDRNQEVTVEPEKTKWDIAYTSFLNRTNSGGSLIPYLFNDVIIQNRNNVQTAEVLNTAGVAYTDFNETHLNAVSFENSQVNIGSKWRTGGGPGSSPAIRNDRFYIVKDAAGNVYKLRFTALTQNGERGKPSIDYELIKKGV